MHGQAAGHGDDANGQRSLISLGMSVVSRRRITDVVDVASGADDGDEMLADLHRELTRRREDHGGQTGVRAERVEHMLQDRQAIRERLAGALSL